MKGKAHFGLLQLNTVSLAFFTVSRVTEKLENI